ncbi:hypothetical protein [Kibdelosporangium aridum]|nr:hypothetical protein [Kibdelosporangium aridum]
MDRWNTGQFGNAVGSPLQSGGWHTNSAMDQVCVRAKISTVTRRP